MAERGTEVGGASATAAPDLDESPDLGVRSAESPEALSNHYGEGPGRVTVVLQDTAVCKPEAHPVFRGRPASSRSATHPSIGPAECRIP